VKRLIVSAGLAAAGFVMAAWSSGPVQAQSVSAAASPNQAAYLAANCANCHGTVGNAVGGMPGLAGLKRDYIIAQMKAFKEGTRPATIMHQLAKGYTDEQIAVMADFFSRQKAN
jgi:cytochrome subunit of sulfide dehydrogenase